MTTVQEKRKSIVLPVTMVSKLNCPRRFDGEIIVFTEKGKSWRLGEEASCHGYYCIGREGERVCQWYYRDATSEEIALVEAQENREQQEEEQRARCQLELKNLREIFLKEGEHPEGEFSLKGQKYNDTSNSFGGGEWFVIFEDKSEIWYVKNNGTDGGDWSLNNVRTGGAGAIGYRLPFSCELAARIVALHEESHSERAKIKLENSLLL